MGKSTVNTEQFEREFQTAGALTLKALADNVNDVRGTVSNRLQCIYIKCVQNIKQKNSICFCFCHSPVSVPLVSMTLASLAPGLKSVHAYILAERKQSIVSDKMQEFKEFSFFSND